MKRMLKLFSVFALASPSAFSTSCSQKTAIVEKSINIKGRYSNVSHYDWGNDEFSLNITKKDIDSIDYRYTSDFPYLEIKFNQEIDKKTNYNLKFESAGIYYMLKSITIRYSSANDYRTDFLNYSHKIYLMFEFGFDGDKAQIDISYLQGLFPPKGDDRSYAELSIEATQI